MPTNILHNEIPTKNIAQYLSSGDRAIVETTDGKVYSYDVSRRKGQRFKLETMGFHPGMWLQPVLAAQCGTPVMICAVGEYPFTEFERDMGFHRRVYAALTHFLRSLDSELSVDLRMRAARRATRLLQEDAVRAKVEPVLLNGRVPNGFDFGYGPTSGKAGEILQQMIATA